ATYQDVGTPRLRYDLGPANRRRRLEADPTTGVEREHFGVLQLFGGAQGQARAHRSLGGLGRSVERGGRQAFMQFAEGLAARELRALLVGHRQMRQILGKSFRLYLRITHRQATDSSRSRSGLLQSVPIPVWLGPRRQRQAAWRLCCSPCPWHLQLAWLRPAWPRLPSLPCRLFPAAWRRPCRPWQRKSWTLE